MANYFKWHSWNLNPGLYDWRANTLIFSPTGNALVPEENAPLCCLQRRSLKVTTPTRVSVPTVFISFLNIFSLSLASCIHHSIEVACLELTSDFLLLNPAILSVGMFLDFVSIRQAYHPLLECVSSVFLSSLLFMFDAFLI